MTLTLREQRSEDAHTLWRWTHGEQSPEWQRWDGPYFPRAAPLTWEAYQARETVHHPNRRVIALGDECIGMVTRHEEDPQGGGWWELGIVIFDPRHWGGGRGGEALRQWTTLTFGGTDAHVITLSTWSGNERMVRSAVRVGYRECARVPEARSWNGRRWDSVRLAVLRRDWED